MTRSAKLSILSVAVISAIAVSEARAGFTYDLRFDPTSQGVSADGRTVTLGGTNTQTSYTLDLWGRITGDAASTNDVWTKGLISVASAAGTNGNALSSGMGITAGHANTTVFVQSGSNGAGQDFNADGIIDWGSNNSTASSQGTKWISWASTNTNSSPAVPGFEPNGTVAGQSQAYAGDPINSWEVLIATFTVNASSIVAQSDHLDFTTNFNVITLPSSVKTGNGAAATSLVFYQDGSSTAFNSPSATIGLGATFELPAANVPEPASLGVLALGGLALLARRRKTA